MASLGFSAAGSDTGCGGAATFVSSFSAIAFVGLTRSLLGCSATVSALPVSVSAALEVVLLVPEGLTSFFGAPVSLAAAGVLSCLFAVFTAAFPFSGADSSELSALIAGSATGCLGSKTAFSEGSSGVAC